MRLGLSSHEGEYILIAGTAENKYIYKEDMELQLWKNCEVFLPKFPVTGGIGLLSFHAEWVKVDHCWINTDCYHAPEAHRILDGRRFCAGKVISYEREKEWRKWRKKDYTIAPVQSKEILLSLYLTGLAVPKLHRISKFNYDSYKRQSNSFRLLWKYREPILKGCDSLIKEASFILPKTYLYFVCLNLYHKSHKAIAQIESKLKGEKKILRKKGFARKPDCNILEGINNGNG